jgi:hypothetical protein
MRFFGFHWLFTVVSLSLLVSPPCAGQDICPLTDTSIHYRLDRYISVFVDTTNSLSVDQVTSQHFQSNFKQSSGNLTFGYLKSTIRKRLLANGTLRFLRRFSNTSISIRARVRAGNIHKQDITVLKASGKFHIQATFFPSNSQRTPPALFTYGSRGPALRLFQSTQ